MFGLTERDRTILRLAARGLADKEIGRRLVLAESTVSNEFLAIRRKLSVQNRTRAVVVALKSKTIRLDEV